MANNNSMTVTVDLTGQSMSVDLSVYDFVPIVNLLETYKGEMLDYNAMWSIDDCESCKKDTLELCDDFAESKRNYIIMEVVIPRNSKAFFPLSNVCGYDKWWHDTDGMLEFKSSNASTNLRILDETDPKSVSSGTTEYDLEKAEIEDEYLLEIDANGIERGAKFKVEVFATDDEDDTFEPSTKKIKSGEIRFKVIEKDVFMHSEIDTMKTFLISNAAIHGADAHMDCITTVNHALRLLLGQNLSVSSRMNWTMDKFSEANKVKSDFTVDYLDTEGRVCAIGKPFKADTMQNNVSDKINSLVGEKIGFHIFGLAIMDGYHSMIITVDNTEPCNRIYILSDQNPDNASYNYTNGWKEFKTGNDLDNWILNKTKSWHSNEDSYAGTFVWKLQR